MQQFPLTKTQLGIYFESIARKDEPIYHIAHLLTLSKNADLSELAEAIKKAASAHSFPSLRIAADSEGMPYQYLSEDAQLDLTIEAMSEDDFLVQKSKWPEVLPIENAPLVHIRLIETPSAKYLYTDFHHTIFDGKSEDIFFADINKVLTGQEITAESLSIIDLAIREEKERKSPKYEEAKQWYAKEFGGIEQQSLPLPDIDSHSEMAKNREVKEYTRMLKLSHKSLFEASRKLGVKLSTITDGAFAYMAGTFIGASQAFFSTVYNGRKSSEEESTIAMMVKTLPVYCAWKQDTEVKDFLLNLNTQREKAKENDIYSYSEFCSDLQLQTNLMFSYRGSISGEVFGEGVGPQIIGDGLAFILDHTTKGLILTIDYLSDQYSQSLIESMASAYETVLDQIINAQYLSEISLVEEKNQLNWDSQWHKEFSFDESKTIVDLFREQVVHNENNIAIVSAEEELTYGCLDDLTDRVAEYLHSNGIGKGSVVAIIIPRNEFMAICSLGVLKSGAAYQPLDPNYPSERLEFMLEDSGASLLIADEQLIEKVSGYKGKVLLTKDIEKLSKANQVLDYKPSVEDAFILLYTSGSTGKPKGCRLCHSNLVDFVNVIQPYFHYDSTSKITAYASYGFDANMYELYPGLTCGSSIYVIGEDIRFDMVALNDYFAQVGITHAFMTTQVARAFVTSVQVAPSLKYISCGGETLVPIDKPEGFTMYNLYGPTEATVFITAHEIDRTYDRIPIGGALPNVRLYVVDKNGHILPPYASGELWVAGRQVSSGYLNRPDKTAEVFIDNPFSDEKDYRQLYKTGDIVRRLSDGVIDFIGRNDGQVKVRGFRIELSELEAVIREFPELKDVAVVAYDDPAGGKFIAAYIVANQKIDVSKLNAFIADRKPVYMVPAVTMQIDKIPLTQNQKVDRRALPKPTYQKESQSENRPRNLNSLEKELQKVVASVLKIEEVDVATPLELLGLSSISSIKLAMAIYKRFGIDLKTSDLLGLNSIETVENKLIDYWMTTSSLRGALGDEVISDYNEERDCHGTSCLAMTEGKERDCHGTSYLAMTEGKERDCHGTSCLAMTEEQYPLTISQLGVYADCMRNPKSTNYNIPFYYSFPKSQDITQLSKCVKTIFKLHPYLQTYFTLSGSDVEQKIASGLEPQIEVKTMTEEEFNEYKHFFVRPFNLLKAPLYRISIILTDKSVYLLIDIHHIIFDGTSLSVFISELRSLLNGESIYKEDNNYVDYINKELSIDKTESKQYFAKLLSDCEAASEITADLSQSNDNQGDGVELYEYLDFEAIEAFCKNQGVTPASLCLSATGYVVSRFINTRSVYLNTVSTGRNDVHFAETIGMFVKTLPVVVNIGESSCADFAKQTNAMLHKTVNHEIYPYSEICREYNYAPYIMYEYQIGLENELVVDNQIIKRQSLGNDTLKFKIAVRVEMRSGRPAIIVYYKNGLYSENLMRTFARSIVRVAQTIARNPEQNIRTVSMLDSSDIQCLNEFATTKTCTTIPEKIFYHMFEAQVDKALDKEILVAEDGIYTYSQLEQRANRVANALISKGLQKGESVVLKLHRSSHFFSAVFGVSKAGGVFIPTNPDYPSERIRSIVEDSGSRFIIDDNIILSLEEYPDSTRPNVDVSPSDKVYMIYTSGSTGKPKGVELRHESICNYLTDTETNPQVHFCTTLGSCYGAVTTVAFDMSFKEWAIALCNGIKLVFASDSETLDPMALARRLNDNKVDIFNATPSRLLQYMEVDSFAQAMANCKVILSGGERYPAKLLQLLKEKTKATILNTYGPTEITVSSNAAVLSNTDVISIGRPLLNYEEYIVDNDDNLLPIGVVGELIICGVGVACGYHNLSEQTAKAFVDFKGKRAYRSGDYARWLSDGSVEVLGRKDNQVKLRGLRIELGEIERVLTNVPGVKSGVILIRKIGIQDAICAYYTLEDGVELNSEQIKSKMAEHLTDYMIPSAFVYLESMPLTANGKINNKALPEPMQMVRNAGLEAKSEGEKLFVNIFKEILELDTVYADDNFFELGGSSLTVTRVVIAASKAGVDITYAEVFDNPTPQKLASIKLSNSNVLYPDFEDLSKYDYSSINKILAENNLESFIKGERLSFSKVLLTGATGFLGIHILYTLLHNYPDCKIVCLLRGKSGVSAMKRLSGLFFYYFEESPLELFEDRIEIIEGDITQKDSFKDCINLGVDLVLNCAANVKHFSKGTDIEDVNYYGTLNIIDYCKSTGARLVHISTMSIGGVFIGDYSSSIQHLEENMLYFGQSQVSKYTQSKFLAERSILQAVADGTLSAKIMRVGTLAPRNKDGEYQINSYTNSFMARMKSSFLVGAHSFESEKTTFELSPIDSVAQAILLLANSPKENLVFHPYNNHQLLMCDLFDTMTLLGLPSEAMEEKEYQKALEIAEQDPEKARVLTGFLAYRQGHGVKSHSVEKSTSLTVSVLNRLHFHWPMTDMEYTERFIIALRSLGFFDEMK